MSRWGKKSVVSAALVALVVLNHISVRDISGGLISIKLAGNDVVFHSQVRRIHHFTSPQRRFPPTVTARQLFPFSFLNPYLFKEDSP